MSDLPDMLTLTDVGEGRYEVFQPAESAEGHDVVFSGQLLAQMIMAADRAAEGTKDVRSIHALFARSGTYTKPIVLEVESLHAGRSWASDTVTATQDGKLLSRSLVLLNALDPDLMRHSPAAPGDVPPASALDTGEMLAFPGAEVRPVPGEPTVGDVPVEMAWHRFERSLESPAAAQAVLAWVTCGRIIGLGMRPHRDQVHIEDAHRSLSTGVIGHTIHFTDRFDVGDWLLVVTEAVMAGNGRVYGGGSVFTEDGALVAAFHQDAMARAAEAPLDPRRSM